MVSSKIFPKNFHIWEFWKKISDGVSESVRIVWFIASLTPCANKINQVKSASYGSYGFRWWTVVDLMDHYGYGNISPYALSMPIHPYMQDMCQYSHMQVGMIYAYTLFMVVFTYHKKTYKNT